MEETINKVEPIYLYVNEFKWKDYEDAAKYEGHLKDGKVYSASMGLLGAYVIDIDTKTGTHSLTLTELEGKFDDCIMDINVINDLNILELDISDDDMEMMALRKSHNSTSEVTATKTKEVLSTSVEDAFSEAVRELMKVDEDMAKLLFLIMKETTSALDDESYMSLTDALSVRDDLVGRVANITMATTHLEAHMNSKSNNPTHLLNAIYSILMELKRTIDITQ